MSRKLLIECACHNCRTNTRGICDRKEDTIFMDSNGYCLNKVY